MRLLGGGEAYEAYLAFDEITYAPVVVKVLRPAQVDDASSLRGLRREVETLAAVNHPVVVRGLRHEFDGRPPARGAREHRRAPAVDADPAPRAARRSSSTCRWRSRSPRRCTTSARVGYVHLDIKPSNVIMGAPARLIDLSVARTLRRGRGPDLRDRHRRLHGARAVRRRPATGTPGHASDVWGLGRDPVRGGRRLPGLRRGRPRRATASPSGSRSWSRAVRAARPGARRGRQDGVRRPRAPTPPTRPLPHEFADALEPVLARPAPRPAGRVQGQALNR